MHNSEQVRRDKPKYAVHPDSRTYSQAGMEKSELPLYYPQQPDKRKQNMKSANGFTLIEIMIVVALIGILASIAIPYYGDYVTRGRIPDATSNLASKRVLMEQFFQDNHTYVGAPACNNDTTTSKYFTFSCPVAATVNAFNIVATGTGTMSGFGYSIDQSNAKASDIALPAEASWIASSTTCWIINTAGQC